MVVELLLAPIRLVVGVSHLVVQPTLYQAINDGLMALFFLEIKREIVAGALTTARGR